MNQAALFQSGDDLNIPPGDGLDPFREGTRISRIAQGTGAHNAQLLDAITLRRAVKAAQYLYRLCHCLGGEQAIAEYRFSQPCNLAIFEDDLHLAIGKTRDLQPD